MIEQIAYIAAAALICLVLFATIDILCGLPKKGTVSGADAVGKEIEKRGGDINGGWMIGNIVSSPDASAGVLLASCGYFVFGIIGSIIAAVLVFIGARICADKGIAGTSGALSAALLIWILTTYAGFLPEHFIAGMIIAILIVEGISSKHTTRIIGKIWRRFT